MPKDMGGLGFRDLWVFNKAMLTKTEWRLHDNLTSLWAQVMTNNMRRQGTRGSFGWNN